jgi:hypothetical protein
MMPASCQNRFPHPCPLPLAGEGDVVSLARQLHDMEAA